MTIDFKDIVDKGRWQQIQDHFSEVLKVALRTVDDNGSLLTKSSIPPRLCNEVMRGTVEGILRCEHCPPEPLEKLEENWKDGYVCPNGFYNFLIPLRAKEKTIAYLIVGPVILGKHRENNVYKDTAGQLGIDEENFLDAVRELKVFSFYGIKSVIELLYDIGLYICELAYQNTKLSSLVPEFPIIAGRLYDFYADRLLNALLEITCRFTEADRASIMLWDENTKELYIKMAKGLRQEIINKTRLKIEDGLSGIVVQEKKPLLIDDNVKDRRIQQRLKNPQLKHSLLIPLKAKTKLLGVLNVGTYKADAGKFTSSGIETIDTLTQLVEATLTNLSHPSAQ